MAPLPSPRRLALCLATAALCALLSPLAGCETTRTRTEVGVAGEGAEDLPEDARGPSARAVLRLERGLVLWFRAHTPNDQGQPGKVAFFVARDLRGGLFLESLGFFEPGTSLRLVPNEGALWLFPMGEGRVNAMAQIYHPVTTLGREVEVEIEGRKRRARLLTHEDQGLALELWFVEREGLWRLRLSSGQRELLRLERIGKARWGSRPAPYPAGDPVAAWESVERALSRLDVVGLRQLMTPKLWSRLLPPGEGLTFAEGPVDGRRRLELIRQVVPQLLEVELARTGAFEVQAGQAQAPAILRTRIEGEFNQAPARLDLVSATTPTGSRWKWAGFRPLPAPGTEGPDEGEGESEGEGEPTEGGLEPPSDLGPDAPPARRGSVPAEPGGAEEPGEPEQESGKRPSEDPERASGPEPKDATPTKTPRAG